MHHRSFATLLLASTLAGCTVLFLPDQKQVPAAVELRPREITIRDQETAVISLVVLDQFGKQFEEVPPLVPVEWSVSDPELAHLLSGEVTGMKQGVGTIQVRVGNIAATAKLTVLGTPRYFRVITDTLQMGTVGRPLPDPIALRVVDRLGTGVAGVPVTFKVTAGAGAVSAGTVISDSAGIARAGWTLGPKSGTNTLQVTAAALEGTVLRFTAHAAPDGVARLERVSGDGQATAVATALDQDLVVRALDRNGNTVPSLPVTWSTDGGSLAPASLVTDEQGVARARWTLGTSAGAMAATARAGGLEVKFGATAVSGAPARVRAAGGDQQTGAEFTVLTDSLAIRVTDAHDNAVAGVPVTWAVTHGGGSVAVPVSALSRANGVAKAAWTIGVTLPNAVTATAAGLTVTFRATARPLTPRDTVRTEAGLRYLEVDISRDTLVVAPGDLISVNFSAYLLDGTLVQRVRDKIDPPLRFVAGSGQVIRGFDLGVAGMRKGSIRRLVLSPALGYGDGVMDNIPPNSTLVFDVQVLDIFKARATASASRGTSDGTRIQDGGPGPPAVPHTGDQR